MLKKKKSMLKLSEKVITNVEGKVNENTQKNHLTKEKVIYKVRKRSENDIRNHLKSTGNLK